MERNRIVSTGRGRPRSSEANDAILTAAIALVREKGYDDVTVEAIAERAGVGKATIYRRWPSKEPLVAEAIGRIVRVIPIPDTGTLRGDLRLLMRSAARMYGDPATRLLLSGLVAAMSRNASIATAVRSGFVGTWRSAVAQVVERAAERGDLRRGVDAGFVNDLLSGPLLHRFLIEGDEIDEAFTRRVVDTVSRGLE
jgi:AcrR family transcriptional regulator